MHFVLKTCFFTFLKVKNICFTQGVVKRHPTKKTPQMTSQDALNMPQRRASSHRDAQAFIETHKEAPRYLTPKT